MEGQVAGLTSRPPERPTVFVVTVTLPNSFPFDDVELFLNPDDAVDKARRWLEVGAADVTVRDAGTWLNDTANMTFTMIGLGKALGFETVKYAEAEAA